MYMYGNIYMNMYMYMYIEARYIPVFIIVCLVVEPISGYD